MAVSESKRYVAFVDDLEGLARVGDYFGADNVVAVSTQRLAPDVRRWTRPTLEAEMTALVGEHRARPFSGVLHWREPYVVVANRLAQRLNLPMALPDPLLARDKYRMKQALSTEVPCAESLLMRHGSDVQAVPQRFFPGVLKPRYGFASICAVRVDDARALRRELAEKADKLVTTHLERVDLGVPAEPDFVLESFVGGSEHTVESFVAAGEVVLQIVSDKQPMTPPHFVESGDLMPSQLDPEARASVCEAARRAIAALRIVHGWTHAEIKLWRGRAWVLEIGARMGGGYTRDVVQAVYEFDMLRALFDYVATGAAPRLGAARAVVLARRVLVSGLSFVWSARSRDSNSQGRVQFLPGESAHRARGVFLGAPYSYGGTLASYLIRAQDAEELARLNAEVSTAMTPKLVQIPLPRSWYRLYLATKRRLDGLRHG